jgi:cellulose synthase/poly-beta-1,6-N-acetylglucosamine synthase-like glycosyltransferase
MTFAHRPLLSPGRALLAIVVSLLAVFCGIEAGLRLLLGSAVPVSLHIAVFFVGFDIGLGIVLLLGVMRRLELERTQPAPASGQAFTPLSVLVAAFDEADVIVETVRGIAAQRGVEFEILIGDDGSNDETIEALRAAFGLLPGGEDGMLSGDVSCEDGRCIPLAVLRRTHQGKGATLNALAAVARHPVLLTLDADTVPVEGAFVAMARAFLDPAVDSAAGVVTVRNGRRNWLLHSQHAEYEKNAIVRIGWSALGALEQVPGAFTGVRARSFTAAGGFPENSLTEDYELTYRIVDQGVREGRVALVITVPGAQVLTDGPPTVRGFIRQRTRWFAGFLTTLARFRRLIGNPRAGGFGIVRLPLKVIDAVLPVIAFATLFVLGKAGFFGLLPASRAAAFLFALRWLWDLLFYAAAEHFSRQLGSPVASAVVHPRRLLAWLCTATEALTYVWLKHLATLRAYVWAVRRARTWEPSRGSPRPRATSL